MIYLVENGSRTQIKELFHAAGGSAAPIREVYSVSDGAAWLVYSSIYTVIVMGAPGETVSYSGTRSGSSTADSYGNAWLSLPRGTYSFTGSLSGSRSGVSVTGDGSVSLWPPNAKILYWYGRFGEGQSLTVKNVTGDFANAYYTPHTNSFSLFAQARRYQSGDYGSCCVHFAQTSFTGYSQLRYVISDRAVSSYGGPHSYLGQKASVDYAYSGGVGVPPYEFTSNGTFTYSIDTSKPYVCACAWDDDGGETSYSTSQFTVNAVYLI